MRRFPNRKARRGAAALAHAYGASDERIARHTGLPISTVRKIARGQWKALAASINTWRQRHGRWAHE